MSPIEAPSVHAEQLLHQVLLYDRALHPRNFPLRKRRVLQTEGDGSYTFEVWLMSGAHVLRFQRGVLCASELMWEDHRSCPSRGIVDAFPCITDREFEHRFLRENVTYMNTVQNENLNDAVYDSTYQELLNHGRENGALIHEWTDLTGQCLSIIDIQRYHREVHAQCYHMIAQGGLVLRSQSIFELN